MPQLPPEYLDSATPPDVEVTDRVRLRYPDPTLGLEVPAAAGAAAGHPLVTVGDSLTHGMSSGAVFDTRLYSGSRRDSTGRVARARRPPRRDPVE
jgi:hypothetical protein